MATDVRLPGDAAGRREPKPLARRLPTVARVLLGLIFLVTGLNGFFNFLPQPTNLPEGAVAFAGALMKTGYLFQLLMSTQLIAAVLLLTNRFVPLALTVLAPIVVNIIAFHLFLQPSGLPLAILVLVLEVYLAWAYRDAYRPMLAVRAWPSAR
jgi:uncharacterized membrane protein YphA (DoxX/SURF4 family)